MQAIRDILARLALFDSAQSPRWRMLVTVLGLGLCLVGLGGVVKLWLEQPVYPDAGSTDLLNNTDFDLYIRAADNLSSNPYREDLGTGLDRYGYPPLLADILAGLKAAIGPELVGVAWVAICATVLVSALVLLARRFGVRLGWHWIALIAGVVLMGRVVRMDIYHGQVNVIVLVLLLIGILFRSQNRVIAASVAFAIMMSLKPFMGVVAIYFALRGDWRMVGWSLMMGAAVFLASFIPTWPMAVEAAQGWQAATQHFTSPPFITKPDNQSMYGFALRLFTETKYSTPWINAPALVPAVMAMTVTLAAVLAVVGLHLGSGAERPRVGPRPAVMLLECALVLALMNACGPLTEGNHMILCFGGFAAALIIGIERIQAWSRNSVLWVATIIAWALPCLFVVIPKAMMWITLGDATAWNGLSGWEILLSGRCAILLLGAGGLTAVTLWRERALVAARQERADERFERLANRQPELTAYRLEDHPVRRLPAE